MHEKTRKLIFFYSAIGSLALLLSTTLYLTIFPISDGWSYTPFSTNGLIYKDFYFPATPLMYFQSKIAETLGWGLVGYRLSLLWIPVLYACSLFGIIRRFTSNLVAFLLSLTQFVILFSWRMEAPGGWNTQSQMLLVIGIWFTFLAWEKNPSVNLVASSSRYVALLFTASSFLTAAIMTKQTVALNCLFAAIGLLIWVWTSRNLKTVYALKFITWVLSISLAETLLVYAYFASRNAGEEFLTNIFSGAGKSNANLLTLLVEVPTLFFNYFTDPVLILQVILLVLILLLIVFENRVSKYLQVDSVIFLSLNVLVLYLFMPAAVTTAPFVISLISGISILWVSKKYEFLKNLNWITVPVLIPLMITFIYSFTGFSDGLSFVNTKLTKQWISVGIVSLVISIIWILRKDSITNRLKTYKHDFVIPKTTANIGSETLLILFLGETIGGISFGIISNGSNFYDAWWFVPFTGIFLAAFISYTKKLSRISNLFSKSILAIVTVGSLLSMTMIAKQPYSWVWQFNESSLFEERKIADFEYLNGIYLAKTTYEFYSQIRSSILSAATTVAMEKTGSSSLDDLTIFEFPYSNSIYSLTKLKPYTKSYCPTYWFDVCPNTIAYQDLSIFKRFPPNVVVWQTPRDSAFTMHEKLFVKRSSALRAWEEYKNEMVKTGSWVLIGLEGVPNGSPAGDIEIYAVIN